MDFVAVKPRLCKKLKRKLKWMEKSSNVYCSNI
jgi:hypothetical protein